MNMWTHRLTGAYVQEETTGCITTRKHVNGRHALAIYYKGPKATKLQLHWKSPLFPNLKWDPANFDKPAYFERLQDVAGLFEVDLANLPQEHIDDPGNHPVPLLLKLNSAQQRLYEEGIRCILCDAKLLWGTLICQFCRSPQPKQDSSDSVGSATAPTTDNLWNNWKPTTSRQPMPTTKTTDNRPGSSADRARTPRGDPAGSATKKARIDEVREQALADIGVVQKIIVVERTFDDRGGRGMRPKNYRRSLHPQG